MEAEIIAAKSIDLPELIGRYTVIKKVSANEYAGPCPKCGGRDRLRVSSRGWFCRQCQGEPGVGGGHWHDAIDWVMWLRGVDFRTALNDIGGGVKMTPAEIEVISEQRRQREAEEAEQEAATRAVVLGELASSGAWERYNQHPEAIERWGMRGITADWVSYYGLGYCPSHTWHSGDTVFECDSLTIPYWRCDKDFKWQIINLRHRLLDDGAPGGKYRPHLPGAGNNLFYTDPAIRHLFGTVLLVEGEIKSMVTWAALWDGDTCLAPAVCVVGTAGKNLKPEHLRELETADRVVICLDPDARQEAGKLAAAIGERASVLSLPGKIDDLLLCEALTGRDILRMIG